VELRRLRHFVAVAEELSFTKAAKKLQITQPPLSRQVRLLERELGVQLLERNTSRVVLTEAGRLFLNEARLVLQHVARAIEIARRSHSGETGTIRVGIGKGLGAIVSKFIYKYRELHPGVEIDVKDIPSGSQQEALVNRAIDIGFLRPPIDNVRLASAHLFNERFSVVVRKSSPLARFKHLRLRQLAQETLLLINRDISAGVYDKTLALYRKAGLSPNVILMNALARDEAGALLIATGRGICIAVGTQPYHSSFAGELTAIPLRESSAFVGVFAAWRKNERARLVVDFAGLVRMLFKNSRKLLDLTQDSFPVSEPVFREGRRRVQRHSRSPIKSSRLAN
jgi:DNA-binding transcriptional LysR family regulator